MAGQHDVDRGDEVGLQHGKDRVRAAVAADLAREMENDPRLYARQERADGRLVGQVEVFPTHRGSSVGRRSPRHAMNCRPELRGALAEPGTDESAGAGDQHPLAGQRVPMTVRELCHTRCGLLLGLLTLINLVRISRRSSSRSARRAPALRPGRRCY